MNIHYIYVFSSRLRVFFICFVYWYYIFCVWSDSILSVVIFQKSVIFMHFIVLIYYWLIKQLKYKNDKLEILLQYTVIPWYFRKLHSCNLPWIVKLRIARRKVYEKKRLHYKNIERLALICNIETNLMRDFNYSCLIKPFHCL